MCNKNGKTSKTKKNYNDKYKINHRCDCNCEQKFYIPLPVTNCCSQVGQVTTNNWFSPGSVQKCCSKNV